MDSPTPLDTIKATLAAEDIRPIWQEPSNAPMCVGDCPSYDGKRCRVLGWRPGAVCVPAVDVMARRLAEPSGVPIDTARVLVEAGIREALRGRPDNVADVSAMVDRVIGRMVPRG